MQPDQTALRYEIQQLHILVRALDAQIASLEARLGISPEQDIPKEPPSIPNLALHRNEVSPTIPNRNALRNKMDIPIPNHGPLRNEVDLSIPKPPSHWNGQTPPIPNEASQSLDYSLPTEAALISVLRRHEAGLSRRTALLGTARLLIHLCTHPTGNSHERLGGLLGFTVSGTAKHMMSMRRRGLITVVGWQHFRPSDKAYGYLAEAAAQPPTELTPFAPSANV